MVRHFAKVDARGLDVTGHAAVDAKAVLPDLRAQGISALTAELASTAGDVKTHRNPVSRRKIFDFRANLGDLARHLMAHD